MVEQQLQSWFGRAGALPNTPLIVRQSSCLYVQKKKLALLYEHVDLELWREVSFLQSLPSSVADAEEDIVGESWSNSCTSELGLPSA